MKTAALFIPFALALALAGCSYQDPRVPLDDAKRDIASIQAYQVQAGPLRPLQDDLQKALLEDGRVQSASVGLSFGSQERDPYGSRLVVRYVVLLELKKGAPPTSQPTEPASEPAGPDAAVQGLVRNALSRCGWEVEEVNTYHYEQRWRVRGAIRGAGKPPAAGAGLDLLPERRP